MPSMTRAELLEEFISDLRKSVANAAPGDGPNTEDQAAWAEIGLRAYAVRVGQGEEVKSLDDADCWGEVAGDFLANLMHLADATGQSFDYALERGREHYRYEVQDEEQDQEDEAAPALV